MSYHRSTRDPGKSKAEKLFQLYSTSYKGLEGVPRPPLRKFSIHTSQLAGVAAQYPGALLVDKVNKKTGMVEGRLLPLKPLVVAIRRALRS